MYISSEFLPCGRYHILIPRTDEYFTLFGKRDFAGVIQLRILRCRDDPGLSEWASKGSYEREAGMSKSERVMG